MKLYFWREDYGESFKSADEFEVKWFDGDIADAASEYAEFYHGERDGWECKWPIVFTVGNESGEVLGRVEVEREYDPVFSGSLVKDTREKV